MLHVLWLFTPIVGGCSGNKEITGDILCTNTYLQIYMIFRAHTSKDRQLDVSQNETLKNLFSTHKGFQ